MNEEQMQGLSILKSGQNCFITGQAGTGKSYLIKHFIQYCHEKNINIAITSTTGISAILIGGTTLHSWAGVLLGEESKEILLQRVIRKKKTLQRWISTKILVIDEVSMLKPELLEKLSYIGQCVRCSDKIFGGIQLIFLGDFYQLPPVNSDYIFKSQIWRDCVDVVIYLQINMRQSDTVFKNLLTEIREGKPTEDTVNLLKTRVGAKINCPLDIIPTKLYSHRADVDKINWENLMALVKENNPLIEWESRDKIINENNKINIDLEKIYLERINKICPAPKILKLCVGAQVMLTYNLDVKSGLANGSRGVIIAIKNNLPIVRFMNYLEYPISANIWEMDLGEDIKATRCQIPLIPSWAVTIHRSQGSTLDCAVLDLGETIFTYGQAYTALSRCKNLDNLSIVTLDKTKLYLASPDVKEYYSSI